MMNDTAEADDVGDWLQKKYPAEFGGEKLLIIHTNLSGDVSKKDMDKARAAARRGRRNQSPVNCIVSRRHAPRRLGRARGDGYGRAAALFGQGEYPA